MMENQVTIAKEISFAGIGVHSGKRTSLSILPLKEERGIIFERGGYGIEIKVDPRKTFANHATVVVYNGTKISTVEHLLAAIRYSGIDNCKVVIEGEEVPILDGSALSFVEGIKSAGFQILPWEKRCLYLKRPFTLTAGDSYVEGYPYNGLKIQYEIDYDHPVIGFQSLQLDINFAVFEKEIAPARTFGFVSDLDYLRENGIAKGASLSNTIALHEKGIVNGPLRFKDEFVRHKILDFLGDISLFSFPVKGHFKIRKGGHALHIKMVNYLLDNNLLSISGDSLFYQSVI
ncbi:MAG: UDP-3-O-acyl-N-acetylglucosamine deacetylase [Candidatus Aminicenantia bacterium]